MGYLIENLRGLTACGSADYTVNSVSYWSDNLLQSELDKTQIKYYQADMEYRDYTLGGTLQVLDYYLGVNNLENSITVYDVNWNEIGTADYTFDAQKGLVTFATNTKGSAYYWSGYGYDLNEAASNVWNQKSAHFAGKVNWSTDNHRVDQGMLYAQAKDMVQFYKSQAGIQVGQLWRDDTDGY